jgi:hypothetical protein
VCTVVLLSRPSHAWPLLLAANRDERLDRAWDGPAAWWPDRPGVIAGRDRSGGGTWMAVRDGLVAAVLNRPGSLGPAPGKRSRGELPLLALDHESAVEAVTAVAALDAGQWRSFNLVIADREGAWFVRGSGDGQATAAPLAPGIVHMVTAHDPDDTASPRVARHLPRLREAPPPEPPDWSTWTGPVADRMGPPGSAINVAPAAGFGTACSSLLGIPAEGAATWLFAAGPPDQAAFEPVAHGVTCPPAWRR